MELVSVWGVTVGFVGACLALRWVVLRINRWVYESKLGGKKYSLPPGDMGLPIIGVMWSFLSAFKSGDPDSFLSSFVTRFGRVGLYKTFMFGQPSIIVTTPEGCRKVLNDDDAFEPGWPTSTVELMGRRSFISITIEEHKRLRRLTAAPINGHDALSSYIQYIEEVVVSSLEKWVEMGKMEFLTQVRKLTFKIIIHIFLGAESDEVMEALEREYTALNYGVRAMAINLPGFAYHRALKARKNLVNVFQGIVMKRREQRKKGDRPTTSKRKDMMDALLDIKDENGRTLDDEDVIDVMLMYLNAGHESSGHITMWATVFLQQHPECFKQAKAEQLEIVKNRPANQKGMTLKEFRQMKYLSNVVDETLRLVTFSLMVFRVAKKDVNISGYLIPKGWKVLAWFRSVHLDSEIYPDPREFNPARWEGFTPKIGAFLPFGAGSRLCPGNDLAKLEISIFLHHFLLRYQLERVNPKSPVMYLPHTRPKDNCLAFVKRQSTSVA